MIFPTSAQTFHKPVRGRSFLSPAWGASERTQRNGLGSGADQDRWSRPSRAIAKWTRL